MKTPRDLHTTFRAAHAAAIAAFTLLISTTLPAVAAKENPVKETHKPTGTTTKSEPLNHPNQGIQKRVFRLAMPGYVFKFPDDHASHDDFKTEWWYYTGHLASMQGEPFGFELTFFRSGVPDTTQIPKSQWKVPNVYMAHFAVTDLPQKKFFFRSQTNRPGVATAGADERRFKVWNGGWVATLNGNVHELKASTPEYSLQLKLTPAKQPVLHGKNGVSQKANCVGCASHYYSMTRMLAEGTLKRGNKTIDVKGSAWMDHEFGSNQLTAEQVGWDWFSLQLDDKSELMLYQMRLKSGKLDPNSSGTIVTSSGKAEHLALSDYTIEVKRTWKSPTTGGAYPAGWHVTVPSKKIELDIEPLLSEQELVDQSTAGISYWEGACKTSGTIDGKPIQGRAYVEMTGYARAFTNKI